MLAEWPQQLDISARYFTAAGSFSSVEVREMRDSGIVIDSALGNETQLLYTHYAKVIFRAHSLQPLIECRTSQNHNDGRHDCTRKLLAAVVV